MPYLCVTSNVPTSSVELQPAMEAISKAVAAALGKPEKVVMVQLVLDTPMLFQGSADPCAMVQLRSIGKIDPETNVQTVAALTEVVSAAVGVPAARIFMNLVDVPRTNFARDGALIPERK